MRVECQGLTAGEILKSTGGKCIHGDEKRTFSGLGTDSREIAPGYLFWALEGERFDGHDFVSAAAEKGASGAVVAQRRAPEGSLPGRFCVIAVPDTLWALGDLAHRRRVLYGPLVVAVTGSAGKTSTKEMIAGILSLSAPTLKTEGNYNNLIGLPLTLMGLRPEDKRAVLEMGMNRPGEIARLTRIARPDVGLITNVAQAHLEGVGDLEGVARAKTELVREMPEEGKVVLNGDDPLLVQTARETRKETLAFGLDTKNHVRAEEVALEGPAGLRFTLLYEGGQWPVKLPGSSALQDVHNALGAAAACFCLGIDPLQVVEGLAQYRGLSGRFQVIELSGGARLVDDTYNANPASLKAGLESLREMAGLDREVIIGLGDMKELGRHTAEAHREAGRRAAELRPRLFVALGEHAPEMIRGALEMGLGGDRALAVNSHHEMADAILEKAGPRSIVFLKGSRLAGMDRVARGILAELGTQVPPSREGEEAPCSTN